jgi:orotidine-5'-phosphate decarboxylase
LLLQTGKQLLNFSPNRFLRSAIGTITSDNLTHSWHHIRGWLQGEFMSETRAGKDKILVALDVTSIDKALDLVRQLKDHVGGFKVGLELCTHAGVPQVVENISQAGGNVFLDLKFKDIPNTVAGAARASSRAGVMMFNVHCDGGLEMMQAAAQAAQQASQLNGLPRPLVIGVTVLTSISQDMLNQEMNVPGAVESQAVHLARLAKTAGLDGVVCSPLEVKAIKSACGTDFITVVPGVRPSWATAGDQRRIMTPREAVYQGADYLVIGRPITNPPAEMTSAAEAAQRIGNELTQLPDGVI